MNGVLAGSKAELAENAFVTPWPRSSGARDLVECGFLSNRREGGQARDSEYRELLADKIAEAIVEVRYGPGVYRGAANTTVNAPEPAGPGLAPPTLRHD